MENKYFINDMYAIKFIYDNSANKTELCCFTFAQSKEDARNQFYHNIHKIFYSHYDDCTITAITKVSIDSGIIFTKGGTVWKVNGENKVVW